MEGENLDQNQKFKPVRKHTLLKILAAVSLLPALVCVIFIGIIVRECVRPIPTPMPLASSAPFLVKQSDLKRPEHVPSKSIINATTATMALAEETSGALKFKPYLPPDAPGIPKELMAKAPEINARFDRVYRLIEEFERNKKTFSPEEAIKRSAQISAAYRAAQDEVQKTAIKGLPLFVIDRDLEYYRWYDQAGMEFYSRAGQWRMAGRCAESFLGGQKFEWMLNQFQAGRMPGTFYPSDFYRETGFRDYDRALYYYRQQGGVNGFANIVNLYFTRKAEECRDRFSTKQKPIGSVKVIGGVPVQFVNKVVKQ